MPIAIPDLATLDQELVDAELERVAALLVERHPELDLKRGLLHDILLLLHGTLSAGERTQLDRYLSARSLKQIEADPTLAEDEIVDDALSNWRITRLPGTRAVGPVLVVLSEKLRVTIGEGSLFEARGLQFQTTQVFSAKPEPELIASSADRLLIPLSDGNWGFEIEVEALEEGVAYRLPRDAVLLPATPPTSFVKARAAADFADGNDVETNDAMLARLQQGFANRSLSNRVTMNALLRATPEFERFVRSSIVGLGDAEMLRDRHTVFPISAGGRVDWYVRTQEALQHEIVTKTATLIEIVDAATSVWQCSLTKDDFPGFYEAARARLPDADADGFDGGFAVTGDVRSYDLGGVGFRPDIVAAEEAVYSRFQTAVLLIRDTQTATTSLTVGDTQDYELDVVGLPLIGEIQDFISQRDVHHFGADALIKAPVPCFVSVTLTIHKQADEPDPDADAIRTAAVAVVQGAGFTGRLDASKIHTAVHAFLDNETALGHVELLGRIPRPDRETVYLVSTEALVVPDDPDAMTTSKTVQFFLEPEDVAVNVVTDVPVAY